MGLIYTRTDGKLKGEKKQRKVPSVGSAQAARSASVLQIPTCLWMSAGTSEPPEDIPLVSVSITAVERFT